MTAVHRLQPVAGLEGIEPSSEVLEASLRPSLRPIGTTARTLLRKAFRGGYQGLCYFRSLAGLVVLRSLDAR
jgi:hypothetical protein